MVLIGVLVFADYPKIKRFPDADAVNRLILYSGGIIFALLFTIRPLVKVNSVGLEIKNPLRTYRFVWADIKKFHAEDRIVVELWDGRKVRCWAVQRARASQMRGRKSIVDDVTQRLENIRQSITS
ncbi:hypothetical protein FAIPA1_520005 [Frankia sp. AiPs1]|uniref:PH domain-containing protein n=1 Tax=Frankia sp. AiPa1 TaxID=573492 RepID=UPI0035A81859